MIAFLKGIILYKLNNHLVVDVGGIGYEVRVSPKFWQQVEKGQNIEVFVHHHIREQEQTLYGFETQEELQLFKKFISVNGVGPKIGLAALSAAPLSELVQAIQLEDHAVFLSVSGIGQKIARRLVLDLRPQMEDFSYYIKEKQGTVSEETDFSVRRDVITALEQLGYSALEIRTMIQDVDLNEVSTEEAIKLALKNY